MQILMFLSEVSIPLILFYIVGFGILMKCKVYEEFVKGAKAVSNTHLSWWALSGNEKVRENTNPVVFPASCPGGGSEFCFWFGFLYRRLAFQSVSYTHLERAALNVSYTYNMEERLDEMLESLDIVIVVLIISAGLLAFVVLYNLNNINITERKRELATIKVLGFYDNEVSAYVYRENILLTIIGTFAGVVLGSLLHRYVIATVEIDNVMFTRIIENISFVYSALLTFAFSVFVNMVMYFKLKKIDMVESLKSVE